LWSLPSKHHSGKEFERVDAKHVCIVDDDAPVREALRMLLSRQGINVACYASAEIFLSQARLAECGCLIVDQKMPRTSGLTLLEQLRESSLPLPVIMITGDSDPTLARRAEKAGAMALLHKPFANESLLALVRLALEMM
jgi:two-component system response regulator FixJ